MLLKSAVVELSAAFSVSSPVEVTFDAEISGLKVPSIPYPKCKYFEDQCLQSIPESFKITAIRFWSAFLQKLRWNVKIIFNHFFAEVNSPNEGKVEEEAYA